MGYWKDVVERLGGGNPEAHSDDYVCATCFADQGLKEFVESEATETQCTFCGAEGGEPIAAPLVEVLLYVKECLDREYDVAENILPYESAEGGYIGDVWTTDEVLANVMGSGSPNDDEGALMEALCDGLGDRAWCRKHPFSFSDDERLNFSWDAFCELVKHHRRYFFLREHRPDSELYNGVELLQELARWCDRFELVKTIAAGSTVYRARIQKPGQTHSTASALGPPPQELATMTNRMSPAGVVMFYGSENAETALREVGNEPGTYVVGEFRTLREVRILDLVGVPTIPSIFEHVPDSLEYDPRPPAIFLNYFAIELSKPIARDDRIHVDYVPSQVVTEYFRTEYLHDGVAIDGVRYGSARHTGQCSVVLFATQDHVVGARGDAHLGLKGSSKPWLELVSYVHLDVTNADLKRWREEAPRETNWIA